MNKFIIASTTALALAAFSCKTDKNVENNQFDYTVDRFADIEVLRYKVPGFENLSLKQKELIYHLTEAALYGRDILTDQNGKYNLAIRTTLEEIYMNFNGDTSSGDFMNLAVYLKQVGCANGSPDH